MRSNKGITLVSLLASLILIIILAATTIVTSMNAYNQMKFEGAKAELEEVQKLVDEIAADYQTYLKELEVGSAAANYSDYFNTRYNVTAAAEKFANKILSAHTADIKALLTFSEIETSAQETDYKKATGFYFTSDDLMKYFGLKGIDPVAVEFSTRTVYSVNGIKDSSDSTKTYYTPSQWNSNSVVKKTAVAATPITVTAKTFSHSGDMYDIDFEFSAKLKDKTIIQQVYMTDETNSSYKSVESFRDITQSTDTVTKIRVTVSITDITKNYIFKFVDSSQNTYESTKKQFN